MYRFFAVCIVLAAACIAAVVFGAKQFLPSFADPTPAILGNDTKVRPVARDNSPEPRPLQEDKPIEVVMLEKRGPATQTLILADGRVIPGEKADVPGDRDGPLLFVATPAKPHEFVPPEKLLEHPMTLLAVRVRRGETVSPEERITDPMAPAIPYRYPRTTDTFEPGTTAIVTVTVKFRKLIEDDEVVAGQILGMIRPDIAVSDLRSKQAKVAAAKSGYTAAVATREEMDRLLRVANKLKPSGGVSLDDLNKAVIQAARYKAEEVEKEEGVKVSQEDMSGAWTTLKLHVIRAPISGTIRTLYKQPGEAIKNFESVLLIQNTSRLRVETSIEVQDALPLRQRLDKAREYRKTANRTSEVGGPNAEANAKVYRDLADALVAVEIEASQPQPPVAVLSGHAKEVTCVAMSRGPDQRIVSGSVDGFVRVWERVSDKETWEERYKINHHAPIRALACTSVDSKRNLLMTATSTGRVRIFDLDNLKAGAKLMPEQHKGPVNAVAFNADGTTAATGGEDRSIMLWSVGDNSRLLRRQSGAHQQAITSLSFTPKGQLVSAGRDKGLFVWNVEDGNGNEKVLKKVGDIPGRSGDVTQLGLHPNGEYTLVDEGRELRVVELSNQRIDGSLANSSASGSFSTLALFSPDGKSILTNGAAAGRLQLWRAPSSETRAAELRQFLWSYPVTCGAFDSTGTYAITGTTDSKVLVWKMPTTAEASRPLKGELTYVESFLDTSNKRVTVRATLDNAKRWVIPGVAATIIIPPVK